MGRPAPGDARGPAVAPTAAPRFDPGRAPGAPPPTVPRCYARPRAPQPFRPLRTVIIRRTVVGTRSGSKCAEPVAEQPLRPARCSL
ncbi:hypothetical protein B6264_14675 [Kitasatospora aureofaciens]|nr:hypothetical protein B6264_14675 [Kitasatospora aureofaciens]